MSLYAIQPDEYVFWEFRTTSRGRVIMEVDATVGINTYIFDAEDWDPDADFNDLSYYARTLRRLEHRHDIRVGPRKDMVAVIWNPSDQVAATDAHLWRK